jgi:hypothetical protein
MVVHPQNKQLSQGDKPLSQALPSPRRKQGTPSKDSQKNKPSQGISNPSSAKETSQVASPSFAKEQSRDAK